MLLRPSDEGATSQLSMMASLQQSAPDAEEVLDESVPGQESLRLTWRFELSHLPLSLPRRLM